MDSKCLCPVFGKNDVCNLCVQVRYLFNFRAYEFCLKRIPESFEDHIVTRLTV